MNKSEITWTSLVVGGLLLGSLGNSHYSNQMQLRHAEELRNINKLIDTTLTERNNIRVMRERDKRLLETIFGQSMDKYVTASIKVNISAYTASVEECDADPSTTADGTPSRIGLIAISPDLRREFNLRSGQLVVLPPMGVFRIHDSTSDFKRKNTPNPVPIRRTVDILHATKKAALKFGFKKDQTLIYVL